MKHTLILTFIFLGIVLVSCDSEPEMKEEANCLTEKIDLFKVDQATCENATIIKYEFQNQEVYAFTQGICISDGGTDVVLEDCSEVCFLGGFGGFQDCNGDLFFDVAQELEIIWENK